MKRIALWLSKIQQAKAAGETAALAVTLMMALALCPQTSAAAAKGALQVYFIDVEGGQATLFVTPAHESLLIDTGWAGNNGRDADRIVAAAKLAGLNRIDYVLITHYHNDHIGGVPQLVERIPVGTFIDHGPNRETADADTEQNWEIYQKILATHGKRLVVKPGDTLPIQGLHATVVSSDGNLIDHPIEGSGAANSYCNSAASYPDDVTENARSLGLLLTFGKVRVLDLGDLTADKEMQLMCPVNKVGKIDVYIVSHHGWEQSTSPALMGAIQSRIAIMDNGAKKGGTPRIIDRVQQAPGLERLWQLHYSEEGGTAHNTAVPYIANLPGADSGYYLKLTVHPDNSMEVFNARTGESQHYAAR
ncbi:MAG TPA: MBL fold metallo-hydrolase [Acidisarcina sp.]|nr:MBL fold metallo-hydrolase [Acidisarcina sp.]